MNQKKDWKEEILVTGSELVEKVKELIAEGNVRRLVIRKPDGAVLLEVPLTAGVAVGGVVTLMTPVLAAIGAMAALVKNFRVEIIRTGNLPDKEDADQDESR